MRFLWYIVGGILVVALVGAVHRHAHGKRRGKMVGIVAGRCSGCGLCARRCKHKVLEIREDGGERMAAVKNHRSCTACGDCVRVCKFGALEIIEKTG